LAEMRERAHRNEPDAVCRGRPCPTLFQFPASPFSLLERITTTKFSLCLSALFLIACVAGAEAADICDAVALREVRAIENSNAIIKRGEHDTGITEYRVEKKTGVKSFCSHGGYCYPAYATVNGREVESLYLTNCKIDKSFYEDIVFIIYSVVVIRSKVPTAKLRYYDLDNRLLDMELCSVCAGTAASLYINKPSSRCGQLVKRALEGNPSATEELKQFPDYCKAWWKTGPPPRNG
jgi:hypothetical protein